MEKCCILVTLFYPLQLCTLKLEAFLIFYNLEQTGSSYSLLQSIPLFHMVINLIQQGSYFSIKLSHVFFTPFM